MLSQLKLEKNSNMVFPEYVGFYCLYSDRRMVSSEGIQTLCALKRMKMAGCVPARMDSKFLSG